MLIRSHGASMLEQIVVHDAAEQLAAQRNLSINQASIDREYDLALRELVDPSRASGTDDFDRAHAEQLLSGILSERNISRDEFMLGMRRNAYLRTLVNAETPVSESELRAEYASACAERAQVRQIQFASLSTASAIADAVKNGEAFDVIAGRFSINKTSAKLGGLMPPFSRLDDSVPIALRDAAFNLKPGEISKPIRMGEWFYILKLDAILPARELDFERVKGELEQQIRHRLAPQAMEALYDRLLQNARVEVEDPTLRAEFKKRVNARIP